VKIIAFLFALHILSLSSFPCCEEICVNEPTTEIEENSNKQDHSGDEQEICSLFCAGACGAVFCASHSGIPTEINHIALKRSASPLTFIPLVIVSIWQPPKLA
jgi:hypothetical protein